MKIESGNLGMESARSYTAFEATYRRFEITDYMGAISTGTQDAAAGAEEEMQPVDKPVSDREASKTDSLQAWLERMQSVRSNYRVRSNASSMAETIHQETMAYIFEMLFGNWKHDLYERLKERYGFCRENPDGDCGEENADPSALAAQQVQSLQLTERTHVYERESTDFNTAGTVKTADGREIQFHVNLNMSREFQQFLSRDLGVSFVRAVDPLVICLDGNPGAVSDQTFYFDLDSDGEEDKIARLCEGSGFLALDRDGNGKIDDGSELFGTKSGDGFADLSEFDSDGNGWIDENDEVWSRLQIWTKDASGKDALYTLAEAGVGAISLSRVATEFAVKDEANQDRAQVRSSGVYLYEDGRAGVIQQIDLVKFAKEA